MRANGHCTGLDQLPFGYVIAIWSVHPIAISFIDSQPVTQHAEYPVWNSPIDIMQYQNLVEYRLCLIALFANDAINWWSHWLSSILINISIVKGQPFSNSRSIFIWYPGRDFTWPVQENEDVKAVYKNILRMFEDKETSTYSIHQLAQTGVGEGKEIGQWFGPNTVAQVLKYGCHVF